MLIYSQVDFFAMSCSGKEWSGPETALAYLNVADIIPHCSEGDSVLISHYLTVQKVFGSRHKSPSLYILAVFKNSGSDN
jgi:hypothetical protein